MCLSIDTTHLWNCTGGMNTILPKDPSLGVLMMLVKIAKIIHWFSTGLKSSGYKFLCLHFLLGMQIFILSFYYISMWKQVSTKPRIFQSISNQCLASQSCSVYSDSLANRREIKLLLWATVWSTLSVIISWISRYLFRHLFSNQMLLKKSSFIYPLCVSNEKLIVIYLYTWH